MSDRFLELKDENERKLWEEIAEQKAVLSALPTSANIVLTRRCNLRCVMCQTSKGPDDVSISRDLFSKIAAELFPTMRYVHTMMGGEPLMAPDLGFFLETMQAYSVKLYLTTNATLLNEQAIERLDGTLEWLKVSIDSCNKDTYELIRAGAKFDTVVRNLKTFSTLRHQMNPVPFFRMGIVLMRSNIEHLSDFVRFASDIGVDEVETMGLVTSDVTDEHLFDYPELTNRAINEAIRTAKTLGIGLFLGYRKVWPKTRTDDRDPLGASRMVPRLEPSDLEGLDPITVSDNGQPLFTVREDEPRPGRLLCNEQRGQICDFFHRPYIYESGDISGCGNNQSFYMGNMSVRPFRKIWNSKLYRELRRSRYLSRDQWHSFCRNCICIDPLYVPGTFTYAPLKIEDSPLERERQRVLRRRHRDLHPGLSVRIKHAIKCRSPRLARSLRRVFPKEGGLSLDR